MHLRRIETKSIKQNKSKLEKQFGCIMGGSTGYVCVHSQVEVKDTAAWEGKCIMIETCFGEFRCGWESHL
jgi:transcription elongation factor Elf1